MQTTTLSRRHDIIPRERPLASFQGPLGLTVASVDRTKFGYPVWKGNGFPRSIGVNGIVGPDYDSVADFSTGGFQFSPDGQHIAYWEKRDDRMRLVIDGREWPPLGPLQNWLFRLQQTVDLRRGARRQESGGRAEPRPARLRGTA
jgi:hypothetical protein